MTSTISTRLNVLRTFVDRLAKPVADQISRAEAYDGNLGLSVCWKATDDAHAGALAEQISGPWHIRTGRNCRFYRQDTRFGELPLELVISVKTTDDAEAAAA